VFLAALGQREPGTEGPERLTEAHYVELGRQSVRVVLKTVGSAAALTAVAALLAAWRHG
jgi:hypothetical protein